MGNFILCVLLLNHGGFYFLFFSVRCWLKVLRKNEVKIKGLRPPLIPRLLEILEWPMLIFYP